MTATTDADRLLHRLLPDLAEFHKREAELSDRIAALARVNEDYRQAVRKWEVARREAVLAGQTEPPEPAAPQGTRYAVQTLMHERVEVQRRRRRLVRESARDVLAALEAETTDVARQAAPLVDKIDRLLAKAQPALDAAVQVRRVAGLEEPPPMTAARLVDAVERSRPLVEQPPPVPEAVPDAPLRDVLRPRVSPVS